MKKISISLDFIWLVTFYRDNLNYEYSEVDLFRNFNFITENNLQMFSKKKETHLTFPYENLST